MLFFLDSMYNLHMEVDIVKKIIICICLSILLILVLFMPLANADCTLYASDGRTITVSEDEAELYKQVGWYDSPDDARFITMYSMDGRTIEIVNAQREAYKNVGWYDSLEDVTITMYSMDGRTLTVYKDLAEAYHKVGWFYNLSDVAVTMYAEDGRTLTVLKEQTELYRQVGWFYNLSDVTVIMYDELGNANTVFKAEAPEKEALGWTYKPNKSNQLMFSDDGRVIYVPKSQTEAYKAVGWYLGGGEIDPSLPMLAITFDDGPGKYTDEILDCLEKYGARATFFVQGKNVAGYSSVVKRAVEIGCEIGNHTWDHKSLTTLSSGQISSEISNTNNAVYRAAGVYPSIYRPPYGAYNNSVLSSVAMPAILWSVDTLDWKTRDADKTFASVRNGAADGAIILMHDIHAPTAKAAVRIIPYLLKQGYQLVTVSELIEAKKGSPVSGKVYNNVK